LWDLSTAVNHFGLLEQKDRLTDAHNKADLSALSTAVTHFFKCGAFYKFAIADNQQRFSETKRRVWFEHRVMVRDVTGYRLYLVQQWVC
jgi:hypothetical protein